MMFAGHSIDIWIIFHLVVFALLALDLGVFNRKAHVIRMKEAVLWSIFWIVLGLAFGGFVYWHEGREDAILYVTGYLVEKSLSVDNLFVFAVIFSAFRVQRQHQHRLLFWGVIGAIVLRALMIGAGTALLAQFHWLIYVFGAFLLFTGIKLFGSGEAAVDPDKTFLIRFARRYLPFTNAEHHGHFTIVEGGKRKFTTFFLALLFVESSDVLFALDSVPAVMGITRDPFLIYTSNIFAILGLRSLFFVLEDMLARFHLLKYGLAIILCLVGIKMLIEGWYKVPPMASLAAILMILVVSVLLSMKTTRKKA
jgi:tellurite resistance protein TerC